MGMVDASGAAGDLRTRGLHVVQIAQTPDNAPSAMIDPDTDPIFNRALADALRIYGKHYLKSQDGIPGEGEDIPVILSRLRGNDEHVRPMTIFGLADDSGKIHGVAFVETYHINEAKADGKPLDGLSHLLTYAATEQPYNEYLHNAAFHAGIVDKMKEVDQKLGFEGNSLLTTEANASMNYEGKPTSHKMDGEFEIKTGAHRQDREVYGLDCPARIIGLKGRYNNANIMQVPYTPPALAGEDAQSLAHIASANDLAPLLKNQDAFNGEGEPLFLTAERLDGQPLTQHHVELQKAFLNKLAVSVASDFGVSGDIVVKALQHRSAGRQGMLQAFDRLSQQLVGVSGHAEHAKRDGGLPGHP